MAQIPRALSSHLYMCEAIVNCYQREIELYQCTLHIDTQSARQWEVRSVQESQVLLNSAYFIVVDTH